MTTLVQEWMYNGKSIKALADEYGLNYKTTRDIIQRACKIGLNKYEQKVKIKPVDNDFRLSYQEQVIFDINSKQSFKDLYLSDGTEETVGRS